MNAVTQLQRQFVDYFASLYWEGFVDYQFTELQKLQDESTPDFMAEKPCSVRMGMCACVSSSRLQLLSGSLLSVPRITGSGLQSSGGLPCSSVEGSSSSLGAMRVKNLCIAFRAYCEAQNCDKCVRCLQQVNHEYFLLRNRLQTLFRVGVKELYSNRQFSLMLLIIQASEALQMQAMPWLETRNPQPE